jgi:hypothetical protein
MEAEGMSQSVYTYQIARRHFLEDSNHDTHCCEKLKVYVWYTVWQTHDVYFDCQKKKPFYGIWRRIVW